MVECYFKLKQESRQTFETGLVLNRTKSAQLFSQKELNLTLKKFNMENGPKLLSTTY